MKRQGGMRRRRMEDKGGGHLFLRLCVGDMRQPLQEHGARGLFDVEIGQFESVSFNFSQLTGPPWVPHIPLIGYKLVFFCFFFVLSLPQFLNPFFFLLFFFYTLPRYFFFPSSSPNGVAASPPMFVKQSVISIKLHLCCL